MNRILLLTLLGLLTMNSSAQDVTFFMPIGNAHAAKILDFKPTKKGVFITIESSPKSWDEIDLIMLFNLTWNNRGPGKVSGSKPVQIELALGTDVYDKLKSSNKLITTLENFIQAPKDHPMKSTANWYALSVTEAIDLPDHLKGKGEIREGFITDWKSTMSEN